MNQPKFAFGDKVMRTAWKKDFFVVRKVRWIPNCYLYTDDCGAEFEEFELQPYQGPKKKKRYVLVDQIDGMIIEFVKESDAIQYSKDHEQYKRAPEYDLEYPSEEVK